MKNEKKTYNPWQWFRENKSGIGNFMFTWLPTIICLVLCSVCLFPWSDIQNPNKKITEVFLERDSILTFLLVSYAVIIAKNNYDLSQKVLKEIKQIHITDADNFFIVREELEPLSKIFQEATAIYFSGGHLSSVIISQNDSLNNFLKKGHIAKFILPNPMNDYILEQYAEKLMVNMSKEAFKDSVILSLKTIMRYKKDGNLKIDVRVYNSVPAFGLQIIEASANNRIYVELYTMQTELSERLLFPVMQSGSGEMYLRFKKQFDILWEDSQNIEAVDGLQRLLKENNL